MYSMKLATLSLVACVVLLALETQRSIEGDDSEQGLHIAYRPAAMPSCFTPQTLEHVILKMLTWPLS